jgi:uncharacterized membrane protein SpoIIM required for sporulation
MRVAELLESRRENWRKLETLCEDMERRRKRRSPQAISRFGSLYRSACADLALADAYQLPPGTVSYLHQLVGRAHNQLYRSRTFNFRAWGKEMFIDVPQRLFRDNCLRLAFAVFWGCFLTAMYLASDYSPIAGFAEAMLGEDQMMSLQQMYSQPIGGDDSATGFESGMAGFYVWHNTGIGLRCFAGGLLFGIGGLFVTVFNGAFLGAAFGYMSTTPQRDNFYHFVTAHGPFELTAIVLSAAAGMRLGFSLVHTGGLARVDALRVAAREAMPTMAAAIVMFGLAALIEGYLSPSSAPYSTKAATAVLSTALLAVYFVLLGIPRRGAADVG